MAWNLIVSYKEHIVNNQCIPELCFLDTKTKKTTSLFKTFPIGIIKKPEHYTWSNIILLDGSEIIPHEAYHYNTINIPRIKSSMYVYQNNYDRELFQNFHNKKACLLNKCVCCGIFLPKDITTTCACAELSAYVRLCMKKNYIQL